MDLPSWVQMLHLPKTHLTPLKNDYRCNNNHTLPSPHMHTHRGEGFSVMWQVCWENTIKCEKM